MQQLNRSAQYTTFRQKIERLRACNPCKAINWTKADSCRIHDRTKWRERRHISSNWDKSGNRTPWVSNGRPHTRFKLVCQATQNALTLLFDSDGNDLKSLFVIYDFDFKSLFEWFWFYMFFLENHILTSFLSIICH